MPTMGNRARTTDSTDDRGYDGQVFEAPIRGSTAPGPGAARTSLAPRGSPHAEQTMTASVTWPQCLWVTWRGGPSGAA